MEKGVERKKAETACCSSASLASSSATRCGDWRVGEDGRGVKKDAMKGGEKKSTFEEETQKESKDSMEKSDEGFPFLANSAVWVKSKIKDNIR